MIPAKPSGCDVNPSSAIGSAGYGTPGFDTLPTGPIQPLPPAPARVPVMVISLVFSRGAAAPAPGRRRWAAARVGRPPRPGPGSGPGGRGAGSRPPPAFAACAHGSAG